TLQLDHHTASTGSPCNRHNFGWVPGEPSVILAEEAMTTKADYDLSVIGGGFAGLIAAATAASRGLSVVVIEAKSRSGERVHTTGILVKEAAEELDFPAHLTRKIRGVRLYSPNLKSIELSAPGYYFMSTDTGALLDWLAARATYAGARIMNNTRFTT